MNLDISLAVKARILQNPVIAQQATVVVNRLPQGIVGNAIVLWVIGETPFNDLIGSIGIDQARLQIDSYAEKPADAAKLASTLWQHLDGFSGVVAGVFIKSSSRVTGVRQLTDRVKVGTDQYRFIATQDFRFTYDSLSEVIV